MRVIDTGPRRRRAPAPGRARRPGDPERPAQPPPGAATAIGLVAAIVVLLLTFGSVVAMGLPIITALIGLGTGLSLVTLATHVFDMPDFTPELAAMIGLGVGIDYALFIVTRFRDGLRAPAGRRARPSIDAMDTAGRAVLFAGTTVIIALLGMFALGMSFLYGSRSPSSLAVLLTMLASLTAAAGAAERFGARGATAGAPPRPRRAAEPAGPTGFWARWAPLVQRAPVAGGASSASAILLVLAVPVFSMHLGSADAGNDPPAPPPAAPTTCWPRASARASTGRCRSPPSCRRPVTGRAALQVGAALRASPTSAGRAAARVSPAGRPRSSHRYPRSSPQDAGDQGPGRAPARRPAPRRRARDRPTVLVGGATAISDRLRHVAVEQAAAVHRRRRAALGAAADDRVPLGGRSRSRPRLMNLLSIGASLGVVVAIFQWGWVAGLIGVDRTGPIEPSCRSWSSRSSSACRWTTRCS